VMRHCSCVGGAEPGLAASRSSNANCPHVNHTCGEQGSGSSVGGPGRGRKSQRELNKEPQLSPWLSMAWARHCPSSQRNGIQQLNEDLPTSLREPPRIISPEGRSIWNLAGVRASAVWIAVIVCRVGELSVNEDLPRARAMKIMSWSCIHWSTHLAAGIQMSVGLTHGSGWFRDLCVCR